ncbi:hypothetical protein [Acidovorax cavernicola]|uniref:hypothetical protein n=1 Tax=Acidovorax cavernicola TaxID=1675792 RepID=UPI00142E2B32|nr:hypothetical protein [Acidovorax cavernicola]
MKNDRELQRKLLEFFRGQHPDDSTAPHMGAASTREVYAALVYLKGHGLVEMERSRSSTLDKDLLWKITSKGIDFIEDDGGLSAILNVVTVRFEAESLKALLEAPIRRLDVPEDERNKYVKALEELPAEATKSLMEKIVGLTVDKAVEAGPTIMQFLLQYMK